MEQNYVHAGLKEKNRLKNQLNLKHLSSSSFYLYYSAFYDIIVVLDKIFFLTRKRTNYLETANFIKREQIPTLNVDLHLGLNDLSGFLKSVFLLGFFFNLKKKDFLAPFIAR